MQDGVWPDVVLDPALQLDHVQHHLPVLHPLGPRGTVGGKHVGHEFVILAKDLLDRGHRIRVRKCLRLTSKIFLVLELY